MTKSLLTVRIGVTVTHIHDRALAERWSAHLMSGAASSFIGRAEVDGGSASTIKLMSTGGSVAPLIPDSEPGVPPESICAGKVDDRSYHQARTAMKKVQRQSESERLSAPTSATLAPRLQLPHGSPSAASTVSNLESPYGSQFSSGESSQYGSQGNYFHSESHQNLKPGKHAVWINKGLDKENNPGDNTGSYIKGGDHNTNPEALSNFKGSGSNNIPTGFETDVKNRLATVERAIRFQKATGATHLQQVEMDPAAFGVPPAARADVRKLRRERNMALHAGLDGLDTKVLGGNAGANTKEKETALSHEAVLFTPSPKPKEGESTSSAPSIAAMEEVIRTVVRYGLTYPNGARVRHGAHDRRVP